MLTSNLVWFICFPEIQECGQRRVPHRHVHLGLAGLPSQPGRLHPAADGVVSGEAALSLRWVSALPPQKRKPAANKPAELPTGHMAASAATSQQVPEAALFIYTQQKHGCTTPPQFGTCDEKSAFLQQREQKLCLNTPTNDNQIILTSFFSCKLMVTDGSQVHFKGVLSGRERGELCFWS